MAARAGDHVLAFDSIAAAQARAGGATVALVDELLSWEERGAIDDAAARLVAAIAATDGIDADVREFAVYDLRTELVNVLRAWTAAKEWMRRTPEVRAPELAGDEGCPSSVLLGARSAITQRVDEPEPWVALSQPARAGGRRFAAARAALAANRLLRRGGSARIVAVPGMNVGVALGRVDPAALKEAGVAVGLFPTLDHGAAARLATTLRLPVAASAWPRPDPGREAAVRAAALSSLGALHEDPALDAALRAQAAHTLGASEHAARQVRATLNRWSRMRALEAIVLPTVATGAGRLAVRWARERGVAVGVVQHGIYAFRGVEGGDRAADAIFTWGPAVTDQVAQWEGVRAQAVTVGTPGITGVRPVPDGMAPVRRVLVATTNNPTGSALGLSAFQEAFLEDVAQGLQRLADAGIALELRLHPAESRGRYEDAVARLGLAVDLRSPEPLDAALDRADLLVSSVSSVAFEAAARGLPVLLWTGRVPPEVRHRHFLSPLADSRPGMFGDAAEFSRLAETLAGEPEEFLPTSFAATSARSSRSRSWQGWRSFARPTARRRRARAPRTPRPRSRRLRAATARALAAGPTATAAGGTPSRARGPAPGRSGRRRGSPTRRPRCPSSASRSPPAAGRRPPAGAPPSRACPGRPAETPCAGR
jgi:hypothetical protein